MLSWSRRGCCRVASIRVNLVSSPQATFRDLLGPVTEVCMKAAQHAQFLVLNLLQQSKRALVSDKKYSDERVDVLSCVLLAERGQLGQPLILTIIYLPSPGRPRHHPEAACGEAGGVPLLRGQVRPQGGGAAAGGGQGTDQWPLPRCPCRWCPS